MHVHNSQKVEATQVSVDEWINTIYCMHTVKYYTALKRKKILIHATTWMTLEDVMLKYERIQLKKQILYDSKDYYCMR